MNVPFYASSVPYLTTAQMVEVDRAMIEDYEIELIQMIEDAGRSLAHLARRRFFAGHLRSKRILVLAGTGGNGGGSLAYAPLTQFRCVGVCCHHEAGRTGHAGFGSSASHRATYGHSGRDIRQLRKP